jgi:hypothetical protein
MDMSEQEKVDNFFAQGPDKFFMRKREHIDTEEDIRMKKLAEEVANKKPIVH